LDPRAAAGRQFPFVSVKFQIQALLSIHMIMTMIILLIFMPILPDPLFRFLIGLLILTIRSFRSIMQTYCNR